MRRTMWFALSCVAVVGVIVAIRAMAPSTATAAHDQIAMIGSVESNTAAKSDRLFIPTRVQTMDTAPVTTLVTTVPMEMPPAPSAITGKVINEPSHTADDTPTKKTGHRRWQDSNAKLIDDPPPRRQAKPKPEKTSADYSQAKTTSQTPSQTPRHVFQCRQDAFGSLLRTLELSPHCSS